MITKSELKCIEYRYKIDMVYINHDESILKSVFIDENLNTFELENTLLHLYFRQPSDFRNEQIDKILI